MTSVESDVLEIAYVEIGDEAGPPVVLIHGWPDTARGWREVAEGLSHLTRSQRAAQPTRCILGQSAVQLSVGSVHSQTVWLCSSLWRRTPLSIVSMR